MTLTNNDIYCTALGMIGSQPSEKNTDDYEERAPYLIASFCCLTRELDKKIRHREGIILQGSFSPVFLPLDKPFPLCEALAAAASLYVAAMLVIEENSSLSDSLYHKYCECISTLSSEFDDAAVGGISPSESYAVCEEIKNKYFFD